MLVSCIMPTTSARAAFVPLAVRNFLAQDYPQTELVIFDDSDGRVGAALHGDARIRYIRHPQACTSLGEKRNLACAAARGELILHWDDDDWYAPGWISSQVHTLEQSGAVICGLSSLLFIRPLSQQCWQYTYPAGGMPWVAGATLAYRKQYWERHPFPQRNSGEDNHFVWSSGMPVAVNESGAGFAAFIHPGNTSRKHINDLLWQELPFSDARSVLGHQLAFYSAACHQEPQ
ncbi:glycosyltransferase family 2 protein [Taibaiella koreensis]|uniref:glycosyltransferase family 2 protein n=1 Tax=Taibaiella koreensis TaxID=1268548 RepID=UPI000E5A0683|nr:glycosyltransferase family A protein [Taibaiella koreensis]